MFYSYRLYFARWKRFSSLRRPIFSRQEKEIRAQVECLTSKASVMLHSGKKMRSNEFGSGPYLWARGKLFLLKELYHWTEPKEKVHFLSLRFSPLHISAWLWQEVCRVTWQSSRDPILPDGQEIGQPKETFQEPHELEQKTRWTSSLKRKSHSFISSFSPQNQAVTLDLFHQIGPEEPARFSSIKSCLYTR